MLQVLVQEPGYGGEIGKQRAPHHEAYILVGETGNKLVYKYID